MPGVNLNQPILSGSASYRADDWLQASASGKLALLASAELRRGLNLGLGAEALVEVGGAFRKFLAADVQAQANAAARVQAQVQVPLDLFNEVGLAIRLQAIAEAAVGISLGVGLDVGNFLALARGDSRMRGAPLKLLELLLEPDGITLIAGVKAKAAASAMAYANFLVTGSLTGAKPGFLVAAEAGLGLKAGAGYQVFANFGLNSPQRFVRRSIDIAVDETLRLVGEQLPDDEARSMLAEMRAPTKMAFRAAFELGSALAEQGGAFDANAGPQLAQRLTTVVLEEGQRFLLEALTTFVLDAFQKLLAQVGIPQAEWDATRPQRTQLANRLQGMPEDPFEPTVANREYWTNLVRDAIQLTTRLTAIAAGSTWREQMAILWSAVQLLFRATERVSSATIRGTVIGLPAHSRSTPFDQPLATQPPDPIRDHIIAALGRSANTVLSESDLVDYLVLDAVLTPLTQAVPHVKKVLDIVFGPSAAGGVAAAKVILREVGAFVPGPSGVADSESSLGALLQGLEAYLTTRLEDELAPMLRQALGNNRDLQLYLDEVILPVLSFSTRLLVKRVLSWNQNAAIDQVAIREACSSVLMKLAGRSLVVSLDVLLNVSLEQIRRELQSGASHVNDSNGMAESLAQMTGLDRQFLAELLQETLLISADTFAPLPATRRERIRGLLYQLTDVLPATGGGEFMEELKDDFFVPNLDAAVELTKEAGDLIADNVGRFLTALFNRLGLLILDELQELFAEAQAQVGRWIEQLEQLAQELGAAILELQRHIEILVDQVQDAWNDAFDALESLFHAVAGSGSRSSVRAKLKDAIVSEAIGVLEADDSYQGLPREAKSFATDRLRDTVGSVLNAKLFDDVWGAVAALAGESAELMEDIRDLDLDGDLTSQIGDLVLDRLEDLVHDLFGGDDPHLDLSITISASFDVPFVGPVGINETIELGRVVLPLDDLLDVLRSGVVGLSAFETATELLADRVRLAIEADGQLHAVEIETQAAVEEQAHVARELAASRRADYGIEVLSPSPAGFYETPTVDIEVFLKGVPVSYLGLGDNEQQRVSFFLNHEELEPAGFLVEERPGATQGDRPPLVLGGRLVLPGHDAVDFRPTGPARDRGTVVRYQPGVPVGPWGQTVLLEPGAVRDGRQRLALFHQQQGKTVAPALGPHQRAVFHTREGKAPRRHASAPPEQAALRVGARAGQQTRDALRGRRSPMATSPAVSLGRGLTGRQRVALADSLGAGLLVRLQLPAARFEPGLNTLAVAIIPGHGERIAHSISFAVLPGQPGTPPKLAPLKGEERDLPLPLALLAFAQPDEKDGPTPKRLASWAAPRKERVAVIRESLQRQQRRATKTRESVAARIGMVQTQSLTRVLPPSQPPGKGSERGRPSQPR